MVGHVTIKLKYRVRRDDSLWRWEVSGDDEVLDFGTAPTSVLARVAALEFFLVLCQKQD